MIRRSPTGVVAGARRGSSGFSSRPVSSGDAGLPGILIAVLVGGCIGGAARYGVTSALPAAQGFPWSTLAVNLVGCYLLALLLGRVPTSSVLRPLLGTGFCGALTTFSAVTVPTAELARDGSPLLSAAYLVASLLGGVAAAAVGVVAGRAVVRRRPGC